MSAPRIFSLQEFGTELRLEMEKAGYSLANFAKHTAGFSKSDLRDYIGGVKAPDKLAIKKIVHCFPILMKYEYTLRHVEASQPEVRQAKPKRTPTESCTRLKVPARVFVPSAPRPVLVPAQARLEIIRQGAGPVLTQPLAAPLTQALKKTRGEMLSELSGMVKKRLGNHTAENYDFTLKNDGQHLTIKLQIEERGNEDLVESGCYIAVGPREPAGLGIFCKTMTSGNFGDIDPRVRGVAELLEIAKILHESVKDRRFDG